MKYKTNQQLDREFIDLVERLYYGDLTPLEQEIYSSILQQYGIDYVKNRGLRRMARLIMGDLMHPFCYQNETFNIKVILEVFNKYPEFLNAYLYWQDYCVEIENHSVNLPVVFFKSQLQTGSELIGVAVDSINGKLYWTCPPTDTLINIKQFEFRLIDPIVYAVREVRLMRNEHLELIRHLEGFIGKEKPSDELTKQIHVLPLTQDQFDKLDAENRVLFGIA